MPILVRALRLLALGVLGVLSFSPRPGWGGDPATAAPADQVLRVEDLTVVAIDPASDPAEARAVVQLPDGKLLVVAPGAEVREAGVRVRKVLPDRLVVDRGEGRARQQIWIFRARPGERSRVQVLDRERPAPPPILKPQSSNPEKDSGNG